MSGLEFCTTLSDFKKSVSYIDFVLNNTYALFALSCTSFPFQDKFNMHNIQKQRMSLLLPYYLGKRLNINGHRLSVRVKSLTIIITVTEVNIPFGPILVTN